jgi:hypothetical protein
MLLLGASVAGSTWLYLYRVSSVATFVDRRGYEFHAAYATNVQPWWSVFAAVVLLAIGTTAAIALMPNRSRAVQRLRDLGSSRRTDGDRHESVRVSLGLAVLGIGAVLARATRLAARAAHSVRVSHT